MSIEIDTSAEQNSMYPFKDNSLQSDIEPLKQDDGPEDIVRISYTEQFSETMDYFRAILRKNELSQRSLNLTAEVIELNPANYTAQHFRRLCLEQLNSLKVGEISDNKNDFYENELEFIDKIAEDSPKNYQLWFHRRKIVEKLNDSTHEFPFIEQILLEDSKNYHAWSHRIWVCTHFNLWKNELKWTRDLIFVDPFNNSAQNHRFYTIKLTSGFIDRAIIDREIDFAFEVIKKASKNESPQNYLQGILKIIQAENQQKSKNISFIVEILEKIENLTEAVIAKAEKCDSIMAYSMLVDINSHYSKLFLQKNSDEAKYLALKLESIKTKNVDKENFWQNKAIKLCGKLANEINTLRKSYWNYYVQTLKD